MFGYAYAVDSKTSVIDKVVARGADMVLNDGRPEGVCAGKEQCSEVGKYSMAEREYTREAASALTDM